MNQKVFSKKLLATWKKITVERSTQRSMDKDEMMKIETIFLSSDEGSTPFSSTSELYQIGNYGDQYDKLTQFLVYTNKSSSTVRVTIPTYDTDLRGFSTSIALDAGSRSTKAPYNFFETATRYFSQMAPHPIEAYQQISCKTRRTRTTILSYWAQADLFWPYDLPETPTAVKTHLQPNIISVTQSLYVLAFHAHSNSDNQITGFLVCGNSYCQVFEESVP